MQAIVAIAKGLAVMTLAGAGVSMVHWNALDRYASVGVGGGVFLLVGAWLH